MFNQEQWDESKVRQLIRDDLVMYTKVAWEGVVKVVKIKAYLAKAILKVSAILGVLGMSFARGTM